MPRSPRRRPYQPKVESLEAIRHLDAAAPGLLPLLAQTPLVEPTDQTPTAWEIPDATLAPAPNGFTLSRVATAPVDQEAVADGLDQIHRYLARSWSRAGIDRQAHEDCTQGVLTTMLEQLGRQRFDLLLSEIGHAGIPQVLSRETPEGIDFLRALDMIKKRAQREKHFLPIDEHIDLPASALRSQDHTTWRGSIQDAIQTSLNPREAELIRATLEGRSPSEIAERWGIAPKTVSNEKTRALAKLRIALEDDRADDA